MVINCLIGTVKDIRVFVNQWVREIHREEGEGEGERERGRERDGDRH